MDNLFPFLKFLMNHCAHINLWYWILLLLTFSNLELCNKDHSQSDKKLDLNIEFVSPSTVWKGWGCSLPALYTNAEPSLKAVVWERKKTEEEIYCLKWENPSWREGYIMPSQIHIYDSGAGKYVKKNSKKHLSFLLNGREAV